MDTQKIAAIFKALADENRVRILKLLRGGESCACRLLEELNITQTTLSHHMKILCDAEIVTGRKDGKWTYYSINCAGVGAVRSLLLDLQSPENEAKEKLR
jgi:ArsR family transcriptional regulator